MATAERKRKLFFCQIEALETAIYFSELSDKLDSWIRKELKEANDFTKDDERAPKEQPFGV